MILKPVSVCNLKIFRLWSWLLLLKSICFVCSVRILIASFIYKTLIDKSVPISKNTSSCWVLLWKLKRIRKETEREIRGKKWLELSNIIFCLLKFFRTIKLQSSKMEIFSFFSLLIETNKWNLITGAGNSLPELLNFH